MKTTRDRAGKFARKPRVGMLALIAVGVLLLIIFSFKSGYMESKYPHLFENTMDYTKEVTEVVVETEPDWASDEDAKAAAMAVIRKKELEAELEQLESEVQERQARITEIEKELGTY